VSVSHSTRGVDPLQFDNFGGHTYPGFAVTPVAASTATSRSHTSGPTLRRRSSVTKQTVMTAKKEVFRIWAGLKRPAEEDCGKAHHDDGEYQQESKISSDGAERRIFQKQTLER